MNELVLFILLSFLTFALDAQRIKTRMTARFIDAARDIGVFDKEATVDKSDAPNYIKIAC